MSKPTVDKMVSENGARFKRKVEMFDVRKKKKKKKKIEFFPCLQLKSKSQMTSAEIRSELLKMSEACKETRGWFSPVSAEASSKLLARLSSPSSSSFCSVAEAAELLMQGADVSARDGLGLSCECFQMFVVWSELIVLAGICTLEIFCYSGLSGFCI
jgi:hypothetical protein